jgi:16S rRNA (cytosine967-C5)-methyltransferase
MTPAARIQAAIDILQSLEATQKPADRFLRDWFRARRYAGSKDRAAISERVFQVFRHRASFAWRMQSESPRALALAALLGDGDTPDTIAGLFDGQGYGPGPLTEDERIALAAPERPDPPANVRGEFPSFLEPELTRAFGTGLIAETSAFTGRAAIDLRINTLKAERDDVLAQLKGEGFDAAPTPYAPDGIRIASGAATAQLSRHTLYLGGAIEFQDEAAQIAAFLCNARPGQRVLDLAAGAGGKSLALAAAMQNEGEIAACDIRAAALEELRDRATRAGARIIRTANNPPKQNFDIVLVDAPCSGTGTWRRQPELKWRLTPARLLELVRTQDELLAQAAQRTAPGGHLIYATCSVLPLENEDRVAEFLKTTEGFSPVPALKAWSGGKIPPGLGDTFRASPAKTGTDGFFTAILERAA